MSTGIAQRIWSPLLASIRFLLLTSSRKTLSPAYRTDLIHKRGRFSMVEAVGLVNCSLPDADRLRQSQNRAISGFTRAVSQVGLPDHTHSETGSWLIAWRKTGSTLV